MIKTARPRKAGRMPRIGALCFALLALFVVATAALAQSGGDYDLTWSTVDGGGATWSSGGEYSLGGTAGQSDAGLLTGGDYALLGGFWAGAGPPWRLYLPLVLRQHP
jgi:hypothetical protein